MRKRPLCIATIIYILGIIIGLYLQVGIALFVILISNLIGIVICYLINIENKKKRQYCKYFVILTIILLLGIIYIKYIDSEYNNFYDNIKKLEDAEIVVTVLSSPIEKEYSYSYEAVIKQINESKKYNGKRVLLNIKKGKEREENLLEYGDIIKIYEKIEIPETARNYGGFDYMKYLKTKKIYGTINVNGEINVSKKKENNVLGNIINSIQENIKNNMRKVLPTKSSELCIGILIGDRSNLDEKIEENFKNSNLTHMLAVSGAHISYVILAVTTVLNRLGKRISKIVTIIFLIFFMALTEFTASVTRASIMAILMLLANLCYRKSDIFNNLAISTIIILIDNPYKILDIGFELSYAGTIGIVIFDKKISEYMHKKIHIQNKILKYMIDSIIVTVSANLIIIPIMAYQFNTISFTFFISNLLAAPLMGIVVIIGFLTYFISIISITFSKIIAVPLNFILLLLTKIAEICGKLPLSSILIKTPYAISIVMYYLIILIILNRDKIIVNIKNKIYESKLKEYIELVYIKTKNIRKKYKIGICIATSITVIFVHICYEKINDNLKIYFIDVGQGDCTLVITPSNKKILIDGGGSEFGSFDVGEKTLIPYLLDRRINKLDYVLISHFDTDHVGGIITLLEKIKVKNIILSRQGEISNNYIKVKELIEKKKINVIIVREKDKIQIDKYVHFDIIFPEENLISDNILNNNSIVAKMNYGKVSILFTGDIEQIAEEKIIEKYQNTNTLQSTILKVAHHGSKSSSIQKMLERIKPKIALIGCGIDNKFGHPNAGVLERLNNMGTKIYRTDENGEISIVVNKNGGIQVSRFNQRTS